MGMLLHNTLMEQEIAQHKAKAEEKPSEVPNEVEPETEPVKKTGGRRKATK